MTVRLRPNGDGVRKLFLQRSPHIFATYWGIAFYEKLKIRPYLCAHAFSLVNKLLSKTLLSVIFRAFFFVLSLSEHKTSGGCSAPICPTWYRRCALFCRSYFITACTKDEANHSWANTDADVISCEAWYLRVSISLTVRWWWLVNILLILQTWVNLWQKGCAQRPLTTM